MPTVPPPKHPRTDDIARRLAQQAPDACVSEWHYGHRDARARNTRDDYRAAFQMLTTFEAVEAIANGETDVHELLVRGAIAGQCIWPDCITAAEPAALTCKGHADDAKVSEALVRCGKCDSERPVFGIRCEYVPTGRKVDQVITWQTHCYDLPARAPRRGYGHAAAAAAADGDTADARQPVSTYKVKQVAEMAWVPFGMCYPCALATPLPAIAASNRAKTPRRVAKSTHGRLLAAIAAKRPLAPLCAQFCAKHGEVGSPKWEARKAQSQAIVDRAALRAAQLAAIPRKAELAPADLDGKLPELVKAFRGKVRRGLQASFATDSVGDFLHAAPTFLAFHGCPNDATEADVAHRSAIEAHWRAHGFGKRGERWITLATPLPAGATRPHPPTAARALLRAWVTTFPHRGLPNELMNMVAAAVDAAATVLVRRLPADMLGVADSIGPNDAMITAGYALAARKARDLLGLDSIFARYYGLDKGWPVDQAGIVAACDKFPTERYTVRHAAIVLWLDVLCAGSLPAVWPMVMDDDNTAKELAVRVWRQVVRVATTQVYGSTRRLRSNFVAVGKGMLQLAFYLSIVPEAERDPLFHEMAAAVREHPHREPLIKMLLKPLRKPLDAGRAPPVVATDAIEPGYAAAIEFIVWLASP